MSIQSRAFRPLAFSLAVISPIFAACGGGGGGSGSSGGGDQKFEILIDNIATAETLVTSSGLRQPVLFSPFVFALHGSRTSPLFQLGQLAPANSLESFAEDGDATGLLGALQQTSGVSLIGIASIPVGSDSSSVLAPGAGYRLVIAASTGDSVTFAGSFLQGNDLLLSTPAEGIALFTSDGTPLTADVTSSLSLLDIGTEVNQEPGAGADQVIRQQAANQGASEANAVLPVNDGFHYPSPAAMVRVTIKPVADS